MNENQSFTLRQLTPFLLCLAAYLGSYVIALPLAAKLIALGPLVVPGGYIAASVTYPCTDIVDEIYGRRFANSMVTMTLIAMCIVLVLIAVDGALPAASNWDLKASYDDIFGFAPRLMVAGIVAFILGQYADVYLFDLIRRASSGRFLWLRNNGSTAVSKLFDCVSFNFIGFYGLIPHVELCEMMLYTYIFYLLIAFLDTPLVYLGVSWARRYVSEV
ncbi:queuosine precursor transporter [bacterium]|nr:queuosine precursor transporter [bacterium]